LAERRGKVGTSSIRDHQVESRAASMHWDFGVLDLGFEKRTSGRRKTQKIKTGTLTTTTSGEEPIIMGMVRQGKKGIETCGVKPKGALTQ